MNSEFKNQYDDLTIYYANELARKYCKFTLEEQKVLHLIFSQIKPYEKNPTTFKLNNGLLHTCTCGGNNEIEWVQ